MPRRRDHPVKEITLPNSYDLIPNILQEPLRWQLPAHAFFLCQLVHPASAGCKLKPLSPGIDEKGDLARIGPPWDASRLKVHKVFEKGTDQDQSSRPRQSCIGSVRAIDRD